MTRVALGLLWLIHFLPLSAQAQIGRAVGLLLYVLAVERRRVALKNLALCFPGLDASERRTLARDHFTAFARSFIEHGILWWGSRERVQSLVRIKGMDNWERVKDRPVILLAPHFVGLDMGGIRIGSEFRVVSVYSKQKNPAMDRMLYRGRTRFVMPALFSRQDGIRPVVRSIRDGLPFYYLPDMDFGSRDSVFVPFFGVQAATITGLSRIAKLSNAVVVPAVTRQLPGGDGYELQFYPAWEGFPSADLAADARRMNAFIEERVREMPSQYLWVHKRFKTRPDGGERYY
jgi:KDO2-lipid IV(A) lauroyltransferase